MMFDQLFINLRNDVNPPCIASASEYAGMHNAGFYCIYPEVLCKISEDVNVVSIAEFWSQVSADEEHVRSCRKTNEEVTNLFRTESTKYSL